MDAKIKYAISIVLLIWSSGWVVASEIAQGMNPSVTQEVAREVKIAVGRSIPPYVIHESDSGMELEIVREVLAFNGYTLKPVYLPRPQVLRRFKTSQKNHRVDGAIPITEAYGLKNVFYSDSHITYQNVAVSLAENQYTIETIADLSNHSVIAFKHAKKFLGPEFHDMADANPRYKEFAQQKLQVTALFKRRIQVVVLDINIYKYYLKQITRADTSLPTVIHPIFPANHYKVGFRHSDLRDDFNSGLQALKSSGRYQEILNRYVDKTVNTLQ